MSLLKKFTIQHMHKIHQKKLSKMKRIAIFKSNASQHPSTHLEGDDDDVQNNNSSKVSKKLNNVVTDNIVTILLSMGFNLRQIMNGYKIYKFQSEEEAINVMTIDQESGNYNHRFIQNKEIENDISYLIYYRYIYIYIFFLHIIWYLSVIMKLGKEMGLGREKIR